MLRKKIQRLNWFFLKRNIVSQLLLLTLASFVLKIVIIPIELLIAKMEHVTEKPPHGADILPYALIVAPLIETLVFQLGVFILFKKVFNWGANKNGYIILISALLFGLSHSYSIRYEFFAFLMGIVLAYAYYLYHKDAGKAFFRVTLLHAMHNGIASAMVLLFPSLK